MALASGIPADVAQIALANPEVRRRAEQTITQLFDEIDYLLEYGTEGAKARLAMSIVPSLLRGAQTAQQDEEREKMRAELNEVRSLLMGLGAQRPESA